MSNWPDKTRAAALVAAGLVAWAMTQPAPALAQSDAPAGRLNCVVGSAIGLVVTSRRSMECRFTPRRGPVQRYVGTVRSFGLDLGTIRGSNMTWRVYGPYARAPRGALSGSYAGAQAGAALGTGATGTILIGGADNEIRLQPLALQSSRGINVALGVTGFELSLARGRGRR
jgi:hypothetical protein